MSDRTVHAETSHFEIVRYNRRGAWYVEPRDRHIPRQHVTVAEAARRAVDGKDALGGVIHMRLPGGQVFDRKVWALVEERAA